MRKEILKICSYYQVQWHKELDIQRFIDLKNYHQEYNRLNRERGVVFSILFLILGLIILPFGLIFVLPSVWYLYKFITSKEEREQKRRILIQNIQRVFLD